MSALVLSLFPGIGLLDRAFELEGFCTVRGPDVLWGGDVRAFHPPAGRFDGVIGGPPCQTFSSLANLVRARGYEPRFGNLIPEFERVVREAEPSWLLMENVPAAPAASIAGYGIHSFVIDHCALDGGDGFGLEQERKRKITFGLRGRAPVDLRRWIQGATFLLPLRERSVTKLGAEHLAKLAETTQRYRTGAVLGDLRETPVALGGSGKVKRTRTETITHAPVRAAVTGPLRPFAPSCAHQGEGRGRRGTVTGSDGRGKDGTSGGMRPMTRYKLADACRLQGLPENFLEDAPFTADAKLKAVANGVPIALGRALAVAIREAIRAAEVAA